MGGPADRRACAPERAPGAWLSDAAAIAVLDPNHAARACRQGETMGEIFFRGNLVMKGYLKNALATEEALRWRLVPPAIWR